MLDQMTLDDRYRIERLIGRGGSADVYLAEDEQLGREVAVKILRGELADDATSRRRTEDEAKRVASLNHPNIVQVHDTGSRDGAPYIVMEHLPGDSLAERLADGPLPLDEAMDIAMDLCRALHAAHEKGIVHADVKPRNVLFDAEDRVKMTDFGIARAIDDTTTRTTVLGTAAYVSPEQAKGEPLDRRSDLYSLGALIYEMVAGRPPFVGSSVVEVIQKHVGEQPEPLRKHRDEVPEALEVVTQRALNKRPDARYADAEELLHDLERVREGDDATALLTSAERVTTGRRRWRRAGLVVLAVLALVAAAALALIAPWERDVEVPDVRREMLDEAERALQRHGLEVGEVEVAPAAVPTGTVIRQDPGPGTEVATGREVDLVVAGPREQPAGTDDQDDSDGATTGTDAGTDAGTRDGDEGGDTGTDEPTDQDPERTEGGPPGQDQPPGHGGSPPGQDGEPPGHGGEPPGRAAGQ